MNAFYRVLAVLAYTFSCSFLSTFAAETTAARGSIGLHEAINLTLQRNPDLTGIKFRQKALAGERQSARLRPEFRLVTELENVAGSGEFGGVDAGELTLSLSSVIELGGQRDARLNLVTARQQQLESSHRLVTLDVLTQVTHQFIRVVAAQEQLTVQQNAQQLAQENLHTLTQHVQAGRTPEAELLRAKAAVARGNIDRRAAQQQLVSERLHLSVFWGATTPDFTRVHADLFAFPQVVSLPELLAQLNQNSDLALLAHAAQVSAAELRQTQTQAGRTLEWSAGVRRIQATDDSAMVFGISMPLGARHRASGAIATATANQAGAELQRDSAKIQLETRLVSLFGAHQQALAEVRSLQTDVLPLLKQAMRATTDAFDRGRYSYAEMNLAQRDLLEAQSALIIAAARAHTLAADIERLTGAPSLALSVTTPHSELKDLP